MITQKSNKFRVLWVTEKEFDVAHDTATWVEMVVGLQERCTVQLLADYRQKKVQPKVLHNRIIYYDSAKFAYIKRLTRYISMVRVFRSVLKSFQPNIVLFDCSNPILLQYAVSRRKKYDLKLFSDVRTLPGQSSVLRNRINGKLLAFGLRYAAKHFDGITYITNQMKQYCIEEYRLHPHSSIIWTSGVNPGLFSPASTLIPDSDPFTVLYHGSISKQRRIDNAVRAIPLLKDVDIRLVLLGNGDGLEDLRKLVESLGIKNRVSFKETVNYEEVPNWINRCNAGILPFQNCDIWNTSSPIKLFEYLACGKPVIVTDIPAHRNVLEDSDFAFWAKQSSPQDIAEAIRQACNRRKDFEHLGPEARKLVLSKYTWAQQAEKLKQFFDDVLSSNRVDC